MIRKNIFLLIFFIFLNACSTTSKKTAPDPALVDNYLLAQQLAPSQPEKACDIYSQLALESQFVLTSLALMRAHEICKPLQRAKLKPFKADKSEAWLISAWSDIELALATREKNKSELFRIYLEKSKSAQRKSEKVSWLKKALSIANELPPTGPTSVEKENLTEQLYNLSPSEEPNAPASLALANDYRFLRKFKLAKEVYAQTLRRSNFSFSDKLAAYRGLRLTYRLELDRESALSTTKNMVRFVENYYTKQKKKDLKIIADAQLTLARDLWTLQKITEAEHTLEKLLGRLPSGPLLAETFWTLGRIAEEKKDFALALLNYEKALKEPDLATDFRKKLNWYYSWNLRKQKEFTKSIEVLTQLKSQAETPQENSKYSFWLAYTMREKGDLNESRLIFEDIIKNDSLSYYGLLSHRELEKKISTSLLKTNSSAIETTSVVKEALNEEIFDWLIALNEIELAKNYLNEAAKKLRRNKKTDFSDWSSFFSLYKKIDDPLGLFTAASQLSPDLRKELLATNAPALYPQPHFDIVLNSSKKFNVELEFIYAIMRQESSFNGLARSQMDAFGLMQILPQVAKKTAETHALNYGQADDLYHPEINIKIGTAHLKDLLERHNQEIILATAAYNAHESAIRNWLKTRLASVDSAFRHPTIEFIEDIPYDETRDYVKLVLRNYLTYKLLNSKDSEIKFPDVILKLSVN